MAEDTQSYTVDQLAGDIKAKLPRYKDVDNQKLVNDWIKKYPKYGEHLQAQVPKPPVETPKPALQVGEGPGALPSVGRGVASNLGFDPQKLIEAGRRGGVKEQWHELASQAFDTQLKGMGRWAVSTLKDPYHLTDPIEGIARGFETSVPKIYQGLTTGNHTQAWEGAGELLGNTAQLFAAREKGEFKRTSTVNGAVKAAAEMAQQAKADPVEAAKVAHRATSGPIGRMLRAKANLLQYKDAGGLDSRNQILEASKGIRKEIEDHGQNLERQIDTNIPSGVIDADAEATRIKSLLSDTVKTNEKVHPNIAQVLKEANAVAPGQWKWGTVRQLRSSLGRALGHIEGPQQRVGWQIYDDLGKNLRGVADKYGLVKDWDHYQNLTSQYHHWYSPIVESINDAKNGDQVAGILNKSIGQTKRLVDNFQQYGLDSKAVNKYINLAKKIDNSYSGKANLWRYARGTVAGGATTLGGYATGIGFVPSLMLGGMVGYIVAELTNMYRAARLPRAVLEHIIEQTGIEGKRPLGKGVFPQEPPTEPSEGPSAPQPKSPTTKSTKEAPRATPKEAFQKELMDSLKLPYKPPPTGTGPSGVPPPSEMPLETKPGIVTPVPKTAPAEAVGREPGARPGTTRESKIGRATKARERVAAVRTEKGSTALGGGGKVISGEGIGQKAAEEHAAKEALQRVQSKSIDVSGMQIPELEEAMKELAPDELENLQEGRRKMKWSDLDYVAGLRYEYQYALERGPHTE